VREPSTHVQANDALRRSCERFDLATMHKRRENTKRARTAESRTEVRSHQAN